MNAELAQWLETRPPCVQRLAKEFPLGTTVDLEGTPHFLMGWTEGDQLILSPIDPCQDYDAAMEARVWLCADHLRHG